MSEEMQPIDPVTAAMLMGKTPDPCEPIVEISHKVLTRLMDVVEFGDQLERVEKDRLLAHLKDVLAEEQPELWVIHSVGPGEVHPMISKAEAEKQIAELIALFQEKFPQVPITVNVIPSPFSPLEHFELLAEETVQHRDDLLQHVKALEQKIATAPAPAVAMLPEISRDLLGKIVDEVFDSAIEDASVIKDVYRVIARELAEQPAAQIDRITVPMPERLHADTKDLIARFAFALAAKLFKAEQKYGYLNGWKDPNWMDECRQKLVEHLAKGDPRDVAAFCAFLWHHCESTAPCLWMGTAAQPVSPAKSCTWKRDWETGAYQLGCCDQVWHFTDGTAEENGAKFCHRCAGEIVVEQRVLRAYQVGDNDIVAAYDPTCAIQVLVDFAGYGDDFDEDDVELVSDKVLDATEAFDQDEGKTITLEKSLRQELAELTDPTYLHGWE